LLLFLQKESGFQGEALRISIRKNHFAHSLQKSVFKKWWVWATPDYNHPDFAKAVVAITGGIVSCLIVSPPSHGAHREKQAITSIHLEKLSAMGGSLHQALARDDLLPVYKPGQKAIH
jgi:hypothetical protein